MRMKIEYPVYITPDKGQTMYEVATEISEAIKSGVITSSRIFFVLPNEEVISLKGSTVEEIRDSIARQWAGPPRF